MNLDIPFFEVPDGEERTVYFKRSSLTEWQEYPIPEDLENWYPVVTTSSPFGKQYDPTSDTLQDISMTYEEVTKLRQKAYKEEADPLYLNAQFDVLSGRVPPEEAYQPWLEKVAEIKERYPLTN